MRNFARFMALVALFTRWQRHFALKRLVKESWKSFPGGLPAARLPHSMRYSKFTKSKTPELKLSMRPWRVAQASLLDRFCKLVWLAVSRPTAGKPIPVGGH